MIPVIDMEATGKNISQMRKGIRMTVRELQQNFGFNTPQSIYKWERGETLPSVDNLVILAEIFGVTIDEILVLDEQSGGRKT